MTRLLPGIDGSDARAIGRQHLHTFEGQSFMQPALLHAVMAEVMRDAALLALLRPAMAAAVETRRVRRDFFQRLHGNSVSAWLFSSSQ